VATPRTGERWNNVSIKSAAAVNPCEPEPRDFGSLSLNWLKMVHVCGTLCKDCYTIDVNGSQ